MTRGCALLIVGLLALGAAAPTAGVPASGGTVPTADDLFAVLHPSALQSSFADPTRWWPAFPQFNVGVGDWAPGLRF